MYPIISPSRVGRFNSLSCRPHRLWLVHIQGCAGAVRRVVTRLEGVTDIDIDFRQNKVVVKYNDGLTEEQIITAITKTGKATSLWSY